MILRAIVPMLSCSYKKCNCSCQGELAIDLKGGVMDSATSTLQPVGVRDAKNRFSELAAKVNANGQPLFVLKNGRPWVSIHPEDPDSLNRRNRIERFRVLSQAIERDADSEPDWALSPSDDELLARERVHRYG